MCSFLSITVCIEAHRLSTYLTSSSQPVLLSAISHPSIIIISVNMSFYLTYLHLSLYSVFCPSSLLPSVLMTSLFCASPFVFPWRHVSVFSLSLLPFLLSFLYFCPLCLFHSSHKPPLSHSRLSRCPLVSLLSSSPLSISIFVFRCLSISFPTSLLSFNQ